MYLMRLLLRLSHYARALQEGRRPSRRLIWGMVFAAVLVAIALAIDALGLHLPGSGGAALRLRH